MSVNHSKWTVSLDGQLGWQGRAVEGRKFHIVILDDHALYSDAIINFCINPYFSKARVETFRNGREAFLHLKKALDDDKAPDLFITDYNHPGLDGLLLVMNLRAHEQKLGRKHQLPILMITMMGEAFIQQLHAYPLFQVNRGLGKNAGSETIVEALEEILYRRREWLLESYIAGFQYYEGNKLLPLMRRGTRLLLQREPQNPYDANAVAVYLKDRKIGYLPAGKNRLVAVLMDAGKSFEAEILDIKPEAGDWGKVKVGV